MNVLQKAEIWAFFKVTKNTGCFALLEIQEPTFTNMRGGKLNQKIKLVKLK